MRRKSKSKKNARKNHKHGEPSINSLIKDACGKYFPELVADLPITLLLNMGKRVCPTDFSVRFYYNKSYPSFYRNSEELRKTLRRAWTKKGVWHKQEIYHILLENRRFEKAGDDEIFL